MRSSKRAITLLPTAACLVVGTIYLIPLAWAISLSLRSSTEVFGVIGQHTFKPGNYTEAWRLYGLGHLFGNTIFITVWTVILVLVLATTAAYGVVRYRTRLAEIVFVVILLGLMIPPAAVLLPFFVGMRDVGLYDHLYAVVLAETVFALPFGMLLLRGYIEQVPMELNDASRVDGASEWQSFWHVTLPLIRPAMTTLAIFVVLGTWNGFIWPLLLITDPRQGTLTTALATLSSGNLLVGITVQLLAAASVMAAVPVIAFMFIARRAYIKGIVSGALKQ